MGQPAAKQNDTIVATDTHIVLVPAPSGSTPTPLPHAFNGVINAKLSTNVNIMSQPAAIVGSTAVNTPPHTPTPPGTSFQNQPSNTGTIITGSTTVRINGKLAARNGDKANTCNDPVELAVGVVIAKGTVNIGG